MKIAAVALLLTFVTCGTCTSTLRYHQDITSQDGEKYEHCGHLRNAGYTTNGTYLLHVGNTTVRSQCYFDKKNAFTLIMQRSFPSPSFLQPWAAYEHGFGNPQTNFWAGLANIYAWTSQGAGQLQINMQDWGLVNQNVIYRSFFLGPRDQRYRLHIAGYQGQVGDMLSYHNMMPFSTYDAPDPYQCAAGMQTGWWYNYCAYALPTGKIYQGGYYTPTGDKYDGMFWYSWHGFNYALKNMQMMLIH